MAGRCSVETLAEFGFWATPQTSGITLGSGSEHVFIHSGGDEVLVFDLKEKILTSVLQFPTSVTDLVQSEDKQHLYVACRCAVYCLHLPPILSRSPTTRSLSPTELKVPPEDAVVSEEGVVCLLAVGSALVTLSRRGPSWIFVVNKPGEQSGLYETLGSFRLPIISDGMEEMKPVMNYVCLGDSSSSLENHLEPTLFKLLFGVDSALVKSPVVLCGLPDGRLCSLSLRLSGIRVFHSLEEPVVFVGASVVMETDAGAPHARCLVAVGESGRVSVMKMCQAAAAEGGVRVGFFERFVSGPVTSARVDDSRLYLSTGSDLLSLGLTGESRGGDGPEEGTTRSLQSPISLNVCRITAMTKPALNTGGDVELFSLSDKGRLQRIALPNPGVNAESSTQQPGRSVKDLLSAIADVCERASKLKASIKSKNLTLRHLNQVMNVSFLLLNAAEGTEQPIRCRASTEWARLLQGNSLHLTCVLENNSPYSLEQGWRLNVAVCPLADASQEQRASTSYSFTIRNLSPGQKYELTLPLTAEGDVLVPVTVSCALVFSLRTLLDEKQLASLLKTQNSTISLPLNSLTVDWLHALQLSVSVNEANTATCTSAKASGAFRAFLKSKGKVRSTQSEGESKPYLARIKISSELIRETLQSKSSETESPNACVALLKWLLSEPHRGVTGHPWDSAVISEVLRCRGPDGHFIKLFAKEVNIGVEQESLAVVEVQVESVSLAAVCGSHHAILDRVQALVKRAPSKSSSVRVETLGLRPALLRAEHLLQEIHNTRNSGAFGLATSSGQRSLLKVYQELREHPLVIL